MSLSTASTAHLQLSPHEGINSAGKWVDEQLARLLIGEIKHIPHAVKISAIPFLHPVGLMLMPLAAPAEILFQYWCRQLHCPSAFQPVVCVQVIEQAAARWYIDGS